MTTIDTDKYVEMIQTIGRLTGEVERLEWENKKLSDMLHDCRNDNLKKGKTKYGWS